MNITPGKYRTRDGGEAIVLAVLDTTYDPVVGYRIKHGEVDGNKYSYPLAKVWTTYGLRYTAIEDECDLMERME